MMFWDTSASTLVGIVESIYRSVMTIFPSLEMALLLYLDDPIYQRTLIKVLLKD